MRWEQEGRFPYSVVSGGAAVEFSRGRIQLFGLEKEYLAVRDGDVVLGKQGKDPCI